MASRTQLRLGQVTGSFGDAEGKIVDNLPVAATLAAIPAGSGSLVSTLSQFASAIQRINGGATFTTNAAGVFTQDIKIGADGNEFEINESSDNITLDVTTSDKDLIFTVNDGGSADTEVMRVDGSASSLLIAGSKKIEFNDDGTFIHSDSDGKLKLSADGTAADAINIDSAGGLDVDVADDIALTTTSADGEIQLVSAHTAGRAVFIDADAAAGSIVDIDAGILQIDATGVAGINSGGTLSLGTANSGVAVNIGHATSEVTIGDNLTVTGDLTVNGATVTLDTTNLLVEDRMILLHKGNTNKASNANGTSALAFSSGSNTANEATIFGSVDVDVLAAARMDVTNGTANPNFNNLVALRASSIQLGAVEESISGDGTDITFAVGANGDINIPADIGLTFGDDGEKIEGNGSRLSIASGTEMILDCEGNLILDADGGEIFIDDGGTRRGEITYGNSMLMLSASAGNGIALMSQAGTIMLSNADGSTAGSVDVATSNTVKFLDSDDRPRIVLDSTGGDGTLILSGTVQINSNQGAGDPAAIQFLEAKANGTNTITLDVPAAIASSYSLTLPGADGSADQVLKTDGSGNLSFGDATGDLSRFVFKATQTVAAGNVDFGGSKSTGISALDVGTSNLNITKGHSDLNKALEVYVNGQLLVSGSSGAADTDYTFVDSDTLNFAFALEVDDIIQIIQR